MISPGFSVLFDHFHLEFEAHIWWFCSTDEYSFGAEYELQTPRGSGRTRCHVPIFPAQISCTNFLHDLHGFPLIKKTIAMYRRLTKGAHRITGHNQNLDHVFSPLYVFCGIVSAMSASGTHNLIHRSRSRGKRSVESLDYQSYRVSSLV